MRLSDELIINRFNKVHNFKYKYPNMGYRGLHYDIRIECLTHGEFIQNAGNHLAGSGCPKCWRERQSNLIHGVGVVDMEKPNRKMYKVWERMLGRCYDNRYHKREPTYIGCIVCDEWHYLSNFAKWFDENYIEGNHLDKDILIKGNKVYSPETCCFVPRKINNLFLKSKAIRGYLPIGVTPNGSGKFYAQGRMIGKRNRHIGTFSTPEEAFQAYKEAKESYIKEVATDYYNRGEITKRVYDALMRYEVEITD